MKSNSQPARRERHEFSECFSWTPTEHEGDRKRRHSTLGYVSPTEYVAQLIAAA